MSLQSPYMKAIVAILGSISTWGVTALVDGGVSGVEWFGLVGAVATALGVYGVKNIPQKKNGKG